MSLLREEIVWAFDIALMSHFETLKKLNKRLNKKRPHALTLLFVKV